MYISATKRPIATKFYIVKHYLGGGKAALGFGPDRIRTLVSMAYRGYNGENLETTLVPSFSIGSSYFWQVIGTTTTSPMSSKFGQIGPRTAELAPVERLEKNHRLIMGKILLPL